MNNLMARGTRCLLVQPLFSTESFWNYSDVCALVGAKYPAAPLGMMTVAALLPQEWEFRLVDENVRSLTDADLKWADLICVTGMLPQQNAILEVIERAHAAVKPVAVGGPDATAQPHIYEHADFLVLNEGEVTIPLFLEDLRNGATSGVYRSSERADMSRAVTPRFDLIRFSDYLHVGVQFSRGCPYNCEFCEIIELFGRKPRTKTPAQMVGELQALYDLGYRGHVDFVDDNLIGSRPRAIEMLETVSDWCQRHSYPFYFSTEASINLANDEKLLSLMKANDFRFVFVGIETPDDDVLDQAQKSQNRNLSVVDAIRTFNAHGMVVNAGFILGFDNEPGNIAGKMVSLIQETGICMAMVGMLAAMPSTQLFRRLEKEGRLLAGGEVRANGNRDIDQTSSGLNFITSRPKAEILRDQMEVFRRIYDPESYFARVLLTAAYLAPVYKHRVGLGKTLKLGWAFLKASAKLSARRDVSFPYWKAMLKVLMSNPRAVEAAANLAAMYVHFSRQSRFVIGKLEQAIAEIEEKEKAKLPGLGSAARSAISGSLLIC